MSAKKIPVAILVRVSTLKQENDRQISELQTYADSKGWEVVEICQEQISGNAEEIDRHGLHRVEELAQARRNSIAHGFIETLEGFGVSLYWHQQGIETLLPNGKRNPAAGIMFALLAEMARAERETLSERIKSGLAEARRKGQRLGRPAGTTDSKKEFLAKHRDIVRQLNAGQSIRNTAAITDKGASTVQRVKVAMLH
jgi:DNA invertase Pin-like site-specific DNA recombinase